MKTERFELEVWDEVTFDGYKPGWHFVGSYPTLECAKEDQTRWTRKKTRIIKLTHEEVE